MSMRATFTIDDDAHAFLMKVGGDNRSGYINQLLKSEQQKQLEAGILRANQEEADDAAYQQKLSVWDETLSDGLNS